VVHGGESLDSLHSQLITAILCLHIRRLWTPRTSNWSFVFRVYCSNCVWPGGGGGCITCSSFLTACSPCASHLSVDEPYILSILKSCSFRLRPDLSLPFRCFPHRLIKQLSRVVLQSIPDSSVHIATPLGAGRSGVRFPAKARDFYKTVQIVSEANPGSFSGYLVFPRRG